MPVYHFDYVANGKVVPDPIGTPLDDFDEAKIEAVRALVELARDEIQGPERRKLAIVVREGKTPIMQVVLTIEVKPLGVAC